MNYDEMSDREINMALTSAVFLILMVGGLASVGISFIIAALMVVVTLCRGWLIFVIAGLTWGHLLPMKKK